MAGDQQVEVDVCLIRAGLAGHVVQRERQLLNCAFFLLVRNRSKMAEGVRSGATLASARRRRPLPAEMAGHLPNVATGVGTSPVIPCVDSTTPAAFWPFKLRPSKLPARTPGSRWAAGADPAPAVVVADCRVHGVRNLYVEGSSVFATYGCCNPTLTVVALALRSADHMTNQLAR